MAFTQVLFWVYKPKLFFSFQKLLYILWQSRFFNPDLGKLFEVGGGGGMGWRGKTTSCLKLVRIMLETRKLEIWYESIHTCSLQKALKTLLMSAFFCKQSAFLGKNTTFTQSNSVRDVLEILKWNVSFKDLHPESGFRMAPIGHKSKNWQWLHNFPTLRHL